MGRFKLKSALLATIFVVCALSSTDGQQVGTNCSDPRIRRSWDTYNATEKALYLEAVGVAMDKGFQQKFIQVHVEMYSEMQAHRNCMFIYWHRMLLLGYENMLRSLDSKYRCLTIPYWDHLAATARQATGKCSKLFDCAPFLTDSGLTMTGVSTRMLIYNVTIPISSSTTCVNKGVLSHFCGNNTGCAKCVTRGTKNTLSSTSYPSSATFTSVYQQIFSSNDSYQFTENIEQGVHNMIHSTLGGVMAYFQSPADPIFYLHHALVDLTQVIYLKCQIGADVLLSSTVKGTDSRWYSACLKRDGSGYYTTDSNITMRGAAFDGKTTVNVWQDPNNILYPFFKDIPYKYADYVDAKDLGNYSYTYAISGGLANMYQNCQASNTISATNTTSLLADDYRRGGGSDRPLPIIEPGTTYDEKVKRWNIALYESARIVGYDEESARDQMEMVACQYQDDCLGGVQDYTDLFRTNFAVEGHPRCYTIMQYLNLGDRVIGIPHWKNITTRFLPCAAYEKRSGFAKAIGELKKGLEGDKDSDYAANTASATA